MIKILVTVTWRCRLIHYDVMLAAVEYKEINLYTVKSHPILEKEDMKPEKYEKRRLQ